MVLTKAQLAEVSQHELIKLSQIKAWAEIWPFGVERSCLTWVTQPSPNQNFFFQKWTKTGENWWLELAWCQIRPTRPGPKTGKNFKKGGKYCIQRIMRLAKILFQPKNNWISEKISLRQIHTIIHGTVFARDKEKF